MRALVVALVLAVAGPAGAEPRPAYRVIVHPDNPQTSVSRRFLAEAFLKKTTRWPDGTVIRPVEQRRESALGKRFIEEVIGKSVEAVRSYWQQIIFSGRGVPPPELEDDEQVLRYVLKHAGAVGYVSGGASTGAARVLAVR